MGSSEKRNPPRLMTGDLYKVRLSDTEDAFLRYLCNDTSQLNSNVVAVCRGRYRTGQDIVAEEVVSSGVEFYVHVLLKLGVKLGTWEFCSRGPAATVPNVLFRNSSDYGNPKVIKSNKWWVWKIGEEYTFIGDDKAVLDSSEIGIVVNPKDLLERMRTGAYRFFYPQF